MMSRQCNMAAKRFASSAATRAPGAVEQTSVLPNGLSVSSIELNGAASSLVLAFRAGSRYQPADKQGLVQLLRNSVGKDSAEYSGLALVWNSAANGGKLKATSNRDVFSIELDLVRDNANLGLSLLGQLGTNAVKPWDVEDVKHDTLAIDSAYLNGETAVLEQLHQAAFRNGSLARSNFIQNSISAKDLASYAAERLVTSEAVLVGVNVDFNTLTSAAAGFFPIKEGKASAASPSQYFGGESRQHASGNTTFVAIAGQGSALSSTQDVATQAVVAQLFVAATRAANTTAVNVSYQDNGLVGVQFEATNSTVGQVTQNVVKALKSAGNGNLENAKAYAAVQVLLASENSSTIALDRATQILVAGKATTPAEFAQAINNVSAADVSKFVSKVTGKLSLAVYGTPSLVPYLDELGTSP